MTLTIRPTRVRSLCAIGVGAVSMSAYTLTRAPGLTFIDSGELTASATLLGICHPTGYPLFTLLGWIFAHVPVGSEAVVRLNVMASAACALASALFFLLFAELLASGSGGRGDSAPQTTAVAQCGGALGGALILAFSETFWLQSAAVEVYSLHLLLVSLVLLAFVRASAQGAESRWYLFAFLLGLSFTNHMTTVLLGPGLLYLYFSREGTGRESRRRLARMGPFFLLGLTPYLYLPVRSAQNPLFNWGAPASWERFLWHVGGKQFRVWIFSSTEAAGRQFTYFLSALPAEFAYVGIPLALVGLVLLVRSDRKVFWTTLIFFGTCVAYSINYDIHDIDAYFLLAYICVAFWAAAGVKALVLWSGHLKRWSRAAGWGVPLLCGSVVLCVNYPRVDQSANTLVEEYTAAMFGSLEKNALVISYQWDFWVSASYYVQYVRGERTDVAVVDKELLRRSWYLDELQVRYPGLLDRSRREVEGFRRELYKFEHDLPYNPALIQGKFEEMIRSFIREQIGERPVYVTPEIEAEFTREWERVPEGLASRLFSDTLFHPSPSPRWHAPARLPTGKLGETTMRLYADALVHRAQYYYMKRGYSEEVNQTLRQALLFDPSHQGARRLLSAFAR